MLGAEITITQLPAEVRSLSLTRVGATQLVLGYATDAGSFVATFDEAAFSVGTPFALATPNGFGTALDLTGQSGTSPGLAVFDDGAPNPRAFFRGLTTLGRPSPVEPVSIGEGVDLTYDPVGEAIPLGYAMGYITREALSRPPFIRLAFMLGTDLAINRITSRCQIVGFDQAVVDSVTFSPLALARVDTSLVLAWGEARDMYTDYYLRVVRVPDAQ